MVVGAGPREALFACKRCAGAALSKSGMSASISSSRVVGFRCKGFGAGSAP